MRNWLKTALFVSAFSPALFSVALTRLWEQGPTWNSAYYAVGGCIGLLTLRYIVDALRWNGETLPIILKKIEANDAMMFGVIVTYFIPFVAKALDITFGGMLAVLGLACFGLWLSTSILPSPALRVMGYRFYKAEAANGVVFTLITDRDLLDPREVKTVKKISASMLLEVV